MAYDDDSFRESTLYRWLASAVENESSDLHLLSGYQPALRTHGQLCPIPGEEVLSSASIPELLSPIMTPDQKTQIYSDWNLDYAIEIPFGEAIYRFRVNLFLSNGSLGACLRVIPSRIPDFAWTDFPEPLAKRISEFKSGLVLFTGVTGAGKSTSLALIIELMNRRGGCRILTIEDPIEYRFTLNPRSLVSQREVGNDVASFADGLRFGLRQDPDVILVGEIRDGETARMALSAAETGHLVLSTLHTRDAKGSISRFADLFPQQVQGEVRAQLATCLQSVICQRLLASSIEGEKQELALEIMFNSPAIASAIRTGKLESIDNYILTGRADGMISMDESIKRLLKRGNISFETAESFVSDRTLLGR